MHFRHFVRNSVNIYAYILCFSDVVVQIVDARNPLLFYSEDLETYVKEVDENKINLLLINKSDFLSERQRFAWLKYFEEKNVKVVFWSAAIAAQTSDEDLNDKFLSDSNDTDCEKDDYVLKDNCEIKNNDLNENINKFSILIDEKSDSNADITVLNSLDDFTKELQMTNNTKAEQ